MTTKEQPGADRIDWMRTLPFILMHAACLFVFVVGVSPIALIVCVALYFVRMFAITGFYHRYFSHKSFKTSRVASSCSACSAPRPCSAGPSGGPRIIAITTSIRTSPRTRTRPSSTASCAPT